MDGLLGRLDSAAWGALAAAIDPFSYKDRLTMPKLVCNAGGDEFFLPDDWRYFRKYILFCFSV
jgi:PhoPQ-activated pathogenicity-related protein